MLNLTGWGLDELDRRMPNRSSICVHLRVNITRVKIQSAGRTRSIAKARRQPAGPAGYKAASGRCQKLASKLPNASQCMGFAHRRINGKLH